MNDKAILNYPGSKKRLLDIMRIMIEDLVKKD